MLSWRLGFRSLLRHKRRSIIAALGIALSLAMMIFFVGVAENSHSQMADMGIRLGAGHVLIQGKGYQEQQTLDCLVAAPEVILKRAKQLPGYAGAAPRVRASGLLSAGELSAAIMLGGVKPGIEPKLSNISSKANRRSGNYLRSRSQMPFKNLPGDIYMGKELAETLEVAVGDRVVLTVSPVGSSRPKSAAFVVRGTFQTGLSALDGGYAEITLSEAQKLLALGNKVTQVAVLLDDMKRSDAASQALASSLGPGSELEVLSWKQALRELYEAIALDDASLYIMMGIIFFIVAIGIFNTMLMSVTERTRELGVMMALGTQRKIIFLSIMAESVVLAICSSLVGVGLGLLGHIIVAKYGIDVTAMVDGKMEFAGIAFSGKIYSTLSANVVVKWTLTVMALVVTSALVPALRATRLQPLEAMRHV